VSFTTSELRLLQIADQVEEGRRGRPRKPPATPAVDRKRLRQRAWLNDTPITPNPGGRPRAPYVDEQTERRRAQQRASYQRCKLRRKAQP